MSTNLKFLEYLNKKVIGHTDVKKTLLNAINRQRHRYAQKYYHKIDKDKLIPIQNCLIIGKTGTGKTYLVNCLQKLFDFPFLYIDVSSLTPTSNNGSLNCETVLKLIEAKVTECMATKKYASRSACIDQLVVFFDEIDKVFRGHERSCRWSQKAQGEFLGVIDGTAKDCKGITYEGVTFIFAGAFFESEIYEEDLKLKSIGFCQESSKESIENKYNYEEFLLQYGAIPEFLGRIHKVVKLSELSFEDYKIIADTIIIPKLRENLKTIGCNDFNIQKSKINELIKKCMKKLGGVRLLKKYIEDLAEESEFNSTPVHYNILPYTLYDGSEEDITLFNDNDSKDSEDI